MLKSQLSKLSVIFLILVGTLFAFILLKFFFEMEVVFEYPEDPLERLMVENAYSNLNSYDSPKWLTYRHSYSLNYVEDHCPIPIENYRGSNSVKNRDYIVTTRSKTFFGITILKLYHDCGGAKFIHTRPKKEWGFR